MQPDTVKILLLAGAITDIGGFPRHRRGISMTASRQHHGQGIYHLVYFRNVRNAQAGLQFGPQRLKGRFQAIEPRNEGLIRRQLGEVFRPVLFDELVHRFFLEMPV